MATTNTLQTIVDGEKTAVVKVHGVQVTDATGTNYTLDISTLKGAPSKVKIMQAWCMADGMDWHLEWDASTNTPIFPLNQNDIGHYDFRSFGGITNDAGSGVTGDIILVPHNQAVGDSIAVILELSKS